MALMYYRKLLKELIFLKKKEPNIANHFLEIIKTKAKQRPSELQLHIYFIKRKQKEMKMGNQFLLLLQRVNQNFNQSLKYSILVNSSSYKLIAIYVGLSQVINRDLSLNREYKIPAIVKLEAYQQFKSLKKKKDQEFVKMIVTKVCRPRIRYQDFIVGYLHKQTEYEKYLNRNLDEIKDPNIRRYVESIIKDNAQQFQICPQFINFYKAMFQKDEEKVISKYEKQEKIIEEFISFKYILL